MFFGGRASTVPQTLPLFLRTPPLSGRLEKAGRGQEEFKDLGPGLFLVGKKFTHPPKTVYGMSPSLEASPTGETWGTGSRGSTQESSRSGGVALALASLTGLPSLESEQGQSSIPESPVRRR